MNNYLIKSLENSNKLYYLNIIKIIYYAVIYKLQFINYFNYLNKGL